MLLLLVMCMKREASPADLVESTQACAILLQQLVASHLVRDGADGSSFNRLNPPLSDACVLRAESVLVAGCFVDVAVVFMRSCEAQEAFRTVDLHMRISILDAVSKVQISLVSTIVYNFANYSVMTYQRVFIAMHSSMQVSVHLNMFWMKKSNTHSVYL